MTTVTLSGNHFNVLFNNITLPCQVDADCPPAALCAINQTWQLSSGGICMCFAKAGLSGNTCSSLSEIGIVRVTISCIDIVLNFVLAVLSSYLLMCVWGSLSKRSLKFRTVIFIIVVIFLAALVHILYQVATIFTYILFPIFYITTPHGQRVSPFSFFAATAASLTMTLGILAPLSIPLVWIFTTMQTLSYKHGSLSIVAVINIIVGIVALVVAFTCNSMIALNMSRGQIYTGASIFWSAMSSGFIALNMIALVVVSMLVRKLSTSSAVSVPITTPIMLQASRFLLACGVLIFLFSIQTALWAVAARAPFETNTSDPTTVIKAPDTAIRVTFVVNLLINLVCLWIAWPWAVSRDYADRSLSPNEDSFLTSDRMGNPYGSAFEVEHPPRISPDTSHLTTTVAANSLTVT